MGWAMAEAARAFDCGPSVFARIKWGTGARRGRPSVKFVLRLRELETVCYEELQAWIRG
jgi:hypothetical protein